MRRTLITSFIFFLSGVVIYHKHSFLLIGAVITALFLIAYFKKYISLSFFCILFFIIGIITADIHYKTFENRYEKLSKLSQFEGYVIEKDNGSYTLKNSKDNYNIVFYVYKRNDISPGDFIRFYGMIREKPEFKKPNLNSRWIDAYVSPIESTIQISKRRNLLLLPAVMKYKINSEILKISKTGGGFICGLVSGYTGDINTDDKLKFKELGLSHILAVSGFNLGIVYYFLTMVTRKLSAKLRYILIVVICFIYTSFAGFDPSISRAFIMVFISILAKLINRPYDVLNGISLTAFIMLIINSYNIFNVGFILSFAATYGIVLLKDDIDDMLPKNIRIFRNELQVGLAAFIATLPIIIWYMGVFSLFSILINILISPVISFLTILSFFASFVFIFTGINVFFYPSVLIGELVVKTLRLAAIININFNPGKTSIIFIVLYYFFILLHFEYIKINIVSIKAVYIKSLLIFIIFVSLIYHKPLLKIHILNVGQGDSTFIETPNKQSILIDTGPELNNYVSTRDKVIPYLRRLGYNKIDILIITHPHLDHAGGLNYLIENFKVKKIILYEKPDTLKSSCTYVSKGDYINIDDVKLNILAPKGEKERVSDENETCLIIELKYKDFSMLFTGDASSSDLDFISGNYDILKVPHHGSKFSLSKRMLDDTKIGNAIISVGRNNFGHPAPVVIKEFENRKIRVFRTDKLGDIVIQTQGIEYSILSQ